MVLSDPVSGCKQLNNPEVVAGNIAVIDRGSCMFVDKARNLEAAGAIAAIVVGQSFSEI